MSTLTDKLDTVRWKYDQLVWQHEERKADGDATERDYEDMMDAEAILENEMDDLTIAINNQ
jgi:hypothetical protein